MTDRPMEEVVFKEQEKAVVILMDETATSSVIIYCGVKRIGRFRASNQAMKRCLIKEMRRPGQSRN